MSKPDCEEQVTISCYYTQWLMVTLSFVSRCNAKNIFFKRCSTKLRGEGKSWYQHRPERPVWPRLQSDSTKTKEATIPTNTYCYLSGNPNRKHDCACSQRRQGPCTKYQHLPERKPLGSLWSQHQGKGKSLKDVQRSVSVNWRSHSFVARYSSNPSFFSEASSSSSYTWNPARQPTLRSVVTAQENW